MDKTMDNSRYSRQMIFDKIGKAGQEKLLSSRVAVLGTGALGTVIAGNLCRAGVGYIRLVDRDYVELSNLQRQTLFNEEDVRRSIPKAVAAAEHLEKVNSEITLEPVVADLNSASIDQLCSGVDLILDGSDNLELRYLLNEYCIKNSIPWIQGSALGSAGTSTNIIPGKTPCFRCVYPDPPAPGSYPTCASAGVINMITGLIACVQSAEAIKFLCDSPDLRTDLFVVDLWHNSAEYIQVKQDTNCPVCVQKHFFLLEKVSGTSTAALCGRNAIQISPPSSKTMDFALLASKLEKAGTVEYSQYMLRFNDGKTAFQLFPDGRAIIQGTDDGNIGKSIYAEYIGL